MILRNTVSSIDEQVSLSKDYGKCKKVQIHQSCNNWKKKKLFSVRTKLQYKKTLSREFAGGRNE